jgi:hypothetical protein
MFNKVTDDRLSEWKSLRNAVDQDTDPLNMVAEFWGQAPLIPYNHKIDQYNPNSWPTPWEIIVENRYDDFTLGIMIGYTLKLTEKFSNSKIEVRTMVDENRTKLYNLVYIDNNMVLNYDKWQSTEAKNIPDSFLMENLVDITMPR